MKRYLVGLVLWLFWAVSFAAEPAMISGISVQPSKSFSRFVFIMSQKAVGNVSYSANPDKLTVEFLNARKSFNIQNAKLVGSNVVSFEALSTETGSVKFILYTKGKVRWKTRYLPTNKNEPLKLELDVLSESALGSKQKRH